MSTALSSFFPLDLPPKCARSVSELKAGSFDEISKKIFVVRGVYLTSWHIPVKKCTVISLTND